MYCGDQLDKLKKRIPEANEEDLIAALDDAESAILNRRYPFSTSEMALEGKYYNLQLRIAVVLYNKRGAEGESSHSEAGVNRSYESLDSLLKEITPMGAVI